MRHFVFWFFVVVVLGQAGCQVPTSSAPVAKPAVVARVEATEHSKASDFVIEGEQFAVNGYEFIKLKKQVAFEKIPEPATVSFAVLRQRGKVLATFDGMSHPLGTATEFALVPLLNGSDKELVISQTIPRGGRHWVIRFTPEPNIVFDSGDFQLGGEDLFFSDLDQDGMAEIVLHTEAFGGFEYLSMANSPHPEVILKFDPSTKRYRVSNKLFRNRYLHGIDKKQLHSNLTQRELYLADRLDIFLRYIYAGEEAQGWAFFDAAYQQNDDKALKAKIKARLANEPVYQMLNKQKVDR